MGRNKLPCGKNTSSAGRVDNMKNGTIAAIATPFGSGGIGIIRLSGPDATAIAGKIYRRSFDVRNSSHSKSDHCFRSHHLMHGYILDGSQVVDEVLLVVMNAPHSYTKEDVVEIQSHSGVVVLLRILKLVIRHGARLAEPGEFTKRAFLNGRIDLSQAEAVADTISAKSDTALKISTSQLLGMMKVQTEELIQNLNVIVAQIEAHFEFGDEIEAELDHHHISEQLAQKVIMPTRLLVSQYDEGHLLRDGIRMDIVGRPNVGKSSLLNRLLQKDRAIVTELPGTTRDLIEDCINISGIPIIITDTAGLHRSEDPVEIIGMQKTRDNISRSDLVLFVVDGSSHFLDADLEAYGQIQAKKVLLVINKIDLVENPSELKIPELCQNIPHVKISALYGQGIEDLKSEVCSICAGSIVIDPGRTIIPNMRQKIAIDLALVSLEQALQGLNDGIEDTMIIEDLKQARNALDQIIGVDINSDILDEIFSQFCIGK